MAQTTQNVIVTEAGRGWSSGTADVDGTAVRWEAYRKDETSIRVMISKGGKWANPGTLGSARLAIEPTARKAMK